jgi:hypothetical protein
MGVKMLSLAFLIMWGSQSPPPRAPSIDWYLTHLPVTMEVSKDVRVQRCREDQRQRGRLCIGSDSAFTITRGQTFVMSSYLGEGACHIRFAAKEYTLLSCPWLEGFADRETDIYRPISTPRRPK